MEKCLPVKHFLSFDITIPRQSFIGWLAMKYKLPTKERMFHWEFNGESACNLCRAFTENKDHLFFHSSFTKRIWETYGTLFDLGWQVQLAGFGTLGRQSS